MANWDKHKPTIPREELHKRIADGLKNWQRKGWIPADFGKPGGAAPAKADGPTLDRKARKRVMQAADVAIAALAQGHRQDYVHAVKVINATRRLAGLPTRFMQTMCDGIADAAAIASGEDRAKLDQIARTWLHVAMQPSSRLISIPTPSKGVNDDGQEDRQAGSAAGTDESQGAGEEGGSAGGAGDQALEAPGEDDEPELQPGEGGDGTGGAGGSVAADDPDHG